MVFLFICLLLLFFLVSALCGGLYRTPRETSLWLMGLSCQKIKIYLSIFLSNDVIALDRHVEDRGERRVDDGARPCDHV